MTTLTPQQKTPEPVTPQQMTRNRSRPSRTRTADPEKVAADRGCSTPSSGCSP